MDLSNFSDDVIEVPNHTKYIVIDFVQRKCLYSQEINNFEEYPENFIKDFTQAVEISTESLVQKKNSLKVISKAA